MDQNLSAIAGGSWAIVLFFAATWLTGYAVIHRGRTLLLTPLMGAMFILAILVFISRV